MEAPNNSSTCFSISIDLDDIEYMHPESNANCGFAGQNTRQTNKKLARYGPEETAKLDAVLASVNQIIECLNTEFSDEIQSFDDASSVTSKNYPSDDKTKGVIAVLRSVPTSGDLSSSSNVCFAGASKQEAVEASDKTSLHEEQYAKVNGLGSTESRAFPKENKKLLGDSDGELGRELKFNEYSQGAETRSEVESCEKKNELLDAHLLNKQMTATVSQLKCARVANKTLTSEETISFDQIEAINKGKFLTGPHFSPEHWCSDEVSDGCRRKATERGNLTKQQINSNQSANLSVEKREKFKFLRKANSENSSYLTDSYANPTPKVGQSNSNQSSNFTSELTQQQVHVTEEAASTKGKEKKKLSSTASLPGRVSSYKDNQIAAIKAIFPKRKISRGNKEPVDFQKLSTIDSNCSCFQLTEENNRKASDSFALQSSQTNDHKLSEKKSLTRRKTFLSKQKRFGLYFRRTQSFEEKAAKKTGTEQKEANKLLKESPFDLEGGSESKELSVKLHLKKSVKSRVVPLTAPANISYNPNKPTVERMRYHINKSTQMRKNKSASWLVSSGVSAPKEDDSEIGGSLLGQQDSRGDTNIAGLSSMYENHLSVASDADYNRRRATMDSAPARPAHVNATSSGMLPRRGDKEPTYSSLPRKWHQDARQGRPPLAETYSLTHAWTAFDSDGSPRGSQDSLEESDLVYPKNYPRLFRQGKQNEDPADQQGHDSLSKLATKIGKKNKIRKSIKNVGKSSTVHSHDVDGMAERTWTPAGDCTWSNMSGRRVELGSTRLQSLSELESDALQKVSLQRLHDAELGVTIVIPKDESKILNRKVSMKKKYGVHLSSKEKNKDKGYDHVFGIPIVNVVENDQLLRLQKSASFSASLDYSPPDVVQYHSPARTGHPSSLSSNNSSCSGSSTSIHHQQTSQPLTHDDVHTLSVQHTITKSSSAENISTEELVPTPSPENADSDSVFSKAINSQSLQLTPNSSKSATSTAAQPLRRRGAIAADSINEIDPYQSQLLEALSLSVSGTAQNHRHKEKKRSLLPPTMAQVPYVVQKCCDHITKYGIDVTGIFRLAGSKKRVKQLREEFDRGMDVTIDEDYNPHDVAALLKEFFRDLPEALLTRELYPAFIQTAKLLKHDRLACLRYLVSLLPLTNRDTLHTLLNFLAVVAAHAEGSIDDAGVKISGNKMNVTNLATIFGPNILHRHKKSQSSSESQYQVQSLEKAEDSSAVIKVVEELIRNQAQLFQIPKDEHDEMLRTLKETDPEAVDFLLRRKAANHMREKSKLLSTNSNSPNTLRKAAKEISRENVETFTNGSCSHVDFDECPKSTAESDHDDSPRIYSSMRLSYQQATGHAPLPFQDDEKQKAGKLKLKRPFFKHFRHPTTDSDIDERENSTNSSGADDTFEETPENRKEAQINVIDPSSREGRISTSSLFSMTSKKNRSMSFTDDDLQAILGSNLETFTEKFLYKDSLAEECFTDDVVQHRASSPQQSSEITFDKSNALQDPCNQEKNEAACGTSSSDSGVSSVDSSRNLPDNSPDVIKRRGGFSLMYKPASDRDNPTGEKPKQVSMEVMKCVVSQADLGTADRPCVEAESVDISGKCEQIAIDLKREIKKSEFAQDRDSATYFSDVYHVHLQDKSKFTSTVNVHIENRNSNNNNISGYQHTRESQAMCSSTASAINAALNPSKNLSNSLSAVEEPKVNSALPVIKSLNEKATNRKRLPSSLSPRLHRHYGNNVATSETKTENAGRLQIQKGRMDTQLSDSYLQPKHAVNAAPSSYNTSISTLVRRYSKDDLSLRSDSHSAASRWTSSGFLGKTDSNHNVYERHSQEPCSLKERLKKERNALTSSASSGQLSWHSMMSDRKQLPETLV